MSDRDRIRWLRAVERASALAYTEFYAGTHGAETAALDIDVTVAVLLGHSIETARRYSLPTHQDKKRAIRRIPVDESRVAY